MKRFAFCVAVALFVFAPVAPAHAARFQLGNYNMWIDGRYDFHTWIWAIATCDNGKTENDCVLVLQLPQPNAKADRLRSEAFQIDGRYSTTVDNFYGLRCGDVYYGPTIPTRDVYSWDLATMSGTLESSFATDCNGGPAGTYVYPFTLVRM